LVFYFLQGHFSKDSTVRLATGVSTLFTFPLVLRDLGEGNISGTVLKFQISDENASAYLTGSFVTFVSWCPMVEHLGASVL
jgi:hypothetical protein